MASLKAETSFASNTSSGSPNTPKATSPEQRDIEAIWRQVHEKVIQLAGSDPQFQIEKTLDIDGVLRRLNALQQAGKKEPEKFSYFKHVVRRTLQCIQTIGGMVASGASTVFGPSQMCYNALSFVIQAWQNYEGMFENLAELLEKCGDFLTRLDYYKDNMDANLNRLACQNLRIFVEICDRTIRLRKKSSKLMRFTKQLFLNDDGIQDLLHMMEKLNNKEVPLVNAQIFKTVMDNAGKLETALEDQRLQRKDDDWRKRRKTIAAKLGFPKNTLDTDGEPIPYWQRAFDARKATLIEGTGEWIEENQIFSEWAESKLPTNPALVLQGKNRSGKTSLMANALRSLRKINHTDPTTRKALIYFFPETDRRKSDDEDTSTFIERISRVLLWQIATAYEAMSKSVANIIERTNDFDGSLDLWERLFLENKERQRDTVFYIFIDGGDSEIQSLMPLLERLCSVTDEHRPRIFLTARPETVAGWLAPSYHVHFESIPISLNNGDDVHKYINYQMDNMLITKNPDGNEDISKWRRRIHDEVYEKCGGDYFKLNNTFDKLAKVDLVEDVERILTDAGKTRTDQIDTEIRRLNKERTRREIQEINEIILWIEGGREWFSVETMEALLSIKHLRALKQSSETPLPVVRRTTKAAGGSPRFGSPRIGSPHLGQAEDSRKRSPSPTPIPAPVPASTSWAISLLPFSQKLQEKYGLFSITNSNHVDWRSSEYKERVPSKSFDPSSHMNAASTGPHVIQESEIEIVRHFLKNVCPQPLYERFEFEQFFDGKIGARQKEYISIDDDNINIKIAIACLMVLTDEDLRRDTSLRYYATYWILDHLAAVELSLADRELKAEIGPLLVQLFTEDVGIDSLFWAFDTNVSMKTWRSGELGYLIEARSEWLYSTEGVRELVRWFNDPIVTRSVTSDVGKAFLAAIKAPNANLHEVVLSRAAKVMADHLFRRIEFTKREFLAACCFLRGYLSRLDPERSSQMPDEAAVYKAPDSPAYGQFEDESFSIEEVDQIEIWASEILERSKDSKTLESLWEIHGALIVFQLCASATEIYQARAKKAHDLNPQNWHACHFIASQPITSNDKALEMLGRAKNDMNDISVHEIDWLQDSANSALLARVTLKLGDCLWQAGHDDAGAANLHLESLDYHYVHFKDYGRIFSSYRQRQSWDLFIAFLKAINDHKYIWVAYFDELVNEFLLEFIIDKDSNMLAEAADATNRWDVIEEFFEISMEIGRKSNAHDLLFLLRAAYAETLEEAAGGVRQNKVIAIREAAIHAIRSHPSDALERKFIDKMVDSLALAYLTLADQPGLAPEQVEKYGALIESLVPETDDTYNIFLNAAPTCSLIRFHHKHQLSSKRAVEFTHKIVRTSIELLSDEDETNDSLAFWLISHLATAVGDVENLNTSWTMRNKLQYETERKWLSWKAEIDGTAPITEHADHGTSTETDTDSKPSEPTPTAQNGEQGHTNGNGSAEGTAAPTNAEQSNVQTPTPAAVGSMNDDPKARKLLELTIPASDLVRAAPVPAVVADLTANTTTNDNGSGTPAPDDDSSVGNGGDDPEEPEAAVTCDGVCGRSWTVIDEPLYTCADCVGNVQFDQGCYEQLLKGELRKRDLPCKKEHQMFVIPKWDAALMRDLPRGSVPLVVNGEDKGNAERWITVEEWKARLRRRYLDEESHETTKEAAANGGASGLGLSVAS